MLKAYSIKCRNQVEIKDAKEVKLKKGRGSFKNKFLYIRQEDDDWFYRDHFKKKEKDDRCKKNLP